MNGSYAPVAAAIANVSNIDIFEVQGRRLRGTGGIVEGTEVHLSPNV